MTLTADQRLQLEQILADAAAGEERQRNARLLLRYGEGMETREIAAEVGLSESRTRYWRKLFEREGMAMFRDGFVPPRRARQLPAAADAAPALALSDEQAAQLRGMLDSQPDGEQAKRARLVLSYAAGRNTNEIAAEVGLSASRTRYWRKAFARDGMAIFAATTASAGQRPRTKAEKKGRGKKLPGIAPTDSYDTAGRKLLRLYFSEMMLHRKSQRLGRDPEVVHRMRVATRRMRSVFEVFAEAFTPKTQLKFRRPIRRLGRVLGRVRDLDVLLLHMQEYADGLPPDEGTSFQPLLEEWRLEREGHFAALLAYLESEEHLAFCETFEGFLASETRGAAPEPEVIDGVPKRIAEIAPVLIMERYTDVLAFGATLNRATLDQLHELRIHFKRLRYTMEFFLELLGPQAKKAIRHITDMQDYLGHLQDDQTAGEMITAFVSELDLRQANFPLHQRLNSAPLLTYLAERQSRKHGLLTAFGEVWESFAGRDFRQRFLRALLHA